MPLEGLDELNARFAKAIQDIGVSRTQGFVIKLTGAIEVESAMMTPRDTSFLINSKFNRMWRTPSGFNAEAGYGANYAAAVHNMSGKLKGQPRASFGKTGNNSDAGPMMPRSFGGGTGNGNYWDPDAEPQFLAKAIKTVLTKDLDAIIESQYRI